MHQRVSSLQWRSESGPAQGATRAATRSSGKAAGSRLQGPRSLSNLAARGTATRRGRRSATSGPLERNRLHRRRLRTRRLPQFRLSVRIRRHALSRRRRRSCDRASRDCSASPASSKRPRKPRSCKGRRSSNDNNKPRSFLLRRQASRPAPRRSAPTEAQQLLISLPTRHRHRQWSHGCQSSVAKRAATSRRSCGGR